MRNLNGRCGLALLASLSAAGWAQTTCADVIAQWHFDEDPGSDVAADSVGTQDGVLAGSAEFVAGGISGNAISVTIAGNGLVNMGDAFPFNEGDFSIAVWVQTAPNDQTPDYIFVGKHHATIVAGYFIGVNKNGSYGQTNKAWFYQSVHPGGELISNKIVNDGAWHQVVISYHAGALVEIYVDGTPVDNSRAASPIGFIDAPFLVGGIEFGSTPTGTFNGLVDEVQLYDHALGPCEIRYIFDNPGEFAPDPDPCPGDVNHDDVVDIDDLFGVLGAWGPCDYCSEDVNCDGIVDIDDLFAVLAAWGPCP